MDLATDDYKSSKESFVSGMTGSTVLHINMISFVTYVPHIRSPRPYLLTEVSPQVVYHTPLQHSLPLSSTQILPIFSEWILLVIPLLSITLFADRPSILSAALLLPTALFYFLFPPHELGTPLSSGGAPSPHSLPTLLCIPSHHSDDCDGPSKQPKPTSHLSRLSTYGAHMMLITTLAILAVDFPVFPRALAKCETYGVSLVRLSFLFFVMSQLRCANRWTWVSVPLCFPRTSYPPSHSSEPRCTQGHHLRWRSCRSS